jgi:hypothetical protein
MFTRGYYQTPRKPKTLGFQARFFWRVPAAAKPLNINGLQRNKYPKTGKNTKKCHFYCADSPFFCQIA